MSDTSKRTVEDDGGYPTNSDTLMGTVKWSYRKFRPCAAAYSDNFCYSIIIIITNSRGRITFGYVGMGCTLYMLPVQLRSAPKGGRRWG
jgi:hypothetical protein